MTVAELRKFGLVTGAILIGLIGCLLPWLHSGVETMLRWLLYVGPAGGALIVWALAHPASLIYFYKPWMKLAEGSGLYQHPHYSVHSVLWTVHADGRRHAPVWQRSYAP
jgi:hypothetical protein